MCLLCWRAESQEDIDSAVAAASKAQPAWAALTAEKRGSYLQAFADALRADLLNYARIESRDSGVLKEESGFAHRGTFIISPDHTLRVMQINDLPIGRSVEETLRLLDALNYTDKHGEVCQSGWTVGQTGIKPESPKKYFAKASQTIKA